MAGITSDSMENTGAAVGDPGIADPDNLVRIRLNRNAEVQGRRPGDEFVTDSALAAHYCDVLNIARRVRRQPETGEPITRDVPNAPRDRAMKRRKS